MLRMCFCAQPNTTDQYGVNHTWHIPITAHVVISLSVADRVTGVRLSSLFASFSTMLFLQTQLELKP